MPKTTPNPHNTPPTPPTPQAPARETPDAANWSDPMTDAELGGSAVAGAGHAPSTVVGKAGKSASPALSPSSDKPKPWPGVEKAIWVLIYGGMLLFVAGLAVGSRDSGMSFVLCAIGAAVTVSGVVLIYIRSRL